MQFPKMLLPYEDVASLFFEATNEKGLQRAEKEEKRQVTIDGDKREIDGDWGKYSRHFNPLHVRLFWVY